jgi:hypothetical protein
VGSCSNHRGRGDAGSRWEQDETLRTAHTAALATLQQEAAQREQRLVEERDKALEREQAERTAAVARAAAEGTQETQLLVERYENRVRTDLSRRLSL